MLADDNADIRALVKVFLKSLPLKVEAVENGQLALDWALQNEPQVVLMDMEMPVMDGYDATRAIRQWETEKQLKPHLICALTAHAMPNQAEKCEAAGMNHYLSKPIRLAELETYLGDNPPA